MTLAPAALAFSSASWRVSESISPVKAMTTPSSGRPGFPSLPLGRPVGGEAPALAFGATGEGVPPGRAGSPDARKGNGLSAGDPP
eukprot:CAMPEP_0175710416 /NCGR_PEP_ID=MMETSP0097-20121207/40071_1 /TAXON_ID=311494 /ORGANISM="Alexandrium monilatum, Strain CCMP3105" /LENGTH=84 /DNA_ID=CAMNT_0017017835 /DNA_START=71 /DNA_END=321 /DNA_ORIENTATION=+